MRRKDREINDIDEKLKIVAACKVCRLGMALNGQAYVVPLNFGYECTGHTLVLYFHSAQEGKKIDMLRQNPQVCVEMDARHRLVEGDSGCTYGFAFESLIGFGAVEFLERQEDKIHGLTLLMKHQTGSDMPFHFESAALDAVRVYKLMVTSWTGKRKK
jgi:nitroimidazol reductase NimA-like FMN-containing flavoprotein (pyridoxamine 5'-phosphate oxidase superfamily)